MDLSRMRHEYSDRGLDPGTLAADPIDQLERWLADATGAELPEPNAMVIATVKEGRPRTRTVLAKGVSAGGLEFYTNYTSQKGVALGERGPVAASFVWLPLHRQVNLVGEATRLTAAESDAYFALRPRDSQLGAWASDQSSVISSRADLDGAFQLFSKRHTGTVPRPPHWGGYRIVPDDVEFWQGRANRLHDRIRYRHDGDGWVRERLAP